VCNPHAPPDDPTAQVREVIETRNLLTKQVYVKEEELKAYLDERRVPAEVKLRAKEAYNFYLVRPVPSRLPACLFSPVSSSCVSTWSPLPPLAPVASSSSNRPPRNRPFF
jgi:hypothetical protein